MSDENPKLLLIEYGKNDLRPDDHVAIRASMGAVRHFAGAHGFTVMDCGTNVINFATGLQILKRNGKVIYDGPIKGGADD